MSARRGFARLSQPTRIAAIAVPALLVASAAIGLTREAPDAVASSSDEVPGIQSAAPVVTGVPTTPSPTPSAEPTRAAQAAAVPAAPSTTAPSKAAPSRTAPSTSAPTTSAPTRSTPPKAAPTQPSNPAPTTPSPTPTEQPGLLELLFGGMGG